jgi:hypothetical protein
MYRWERGMGCDISKCWVEKLVEDGRIYICTVFGHDTVQMSTYLSRSILSPGTNVRMEHLYRLKPPTGK